MMMIMMQTTRLKNNLKIVPCEYIQFSLCGLYSVIQYGMCNKDKYRQLKERIHPSENKQEIGRTKKKKTYSKVITYRHPMTVLTIFYTKLSKQQQQQQRLVAHKHKMPFFSKINRFSFSTNNRNFIEKSTNSRRKKV